MSVPFSQVKPASLKLKILPKFPARVDGGTAISVDKVNGVYTIGLDYSRLVQTSQFDAVNSLFAVWNKFTGQWNTLSPQAFVSGSFYSATAASQTIPDGTSLVAIQRTSPITTALTLPLLANQGGAPVSIVDWSTSVASDHAITITPSGGATIMRASSWTVYSNATQLGSVTLRPSIDLNGWIISP